MRMNFATHRFLSLLAVGTLSMVIEYLILLSDNIIAGNFLGVAALSAITLLSPFFTIVVFFSILISIGTTIIISSEVGHGRPEDANRYFSQSIILSIAMSLLLTAVYIFIFLFGIEGLFNVSPQISDYVREYFKYLCFLPLIMPINSLFYCVLMAAGHERTCATASVVNVVTNVALSLLLCNTMGLGGISLATIISNCFQLLILLQRLFSKSNTLSFVPYFSFAGVLRTFKYSLNDAGGFLFLALMQFIMNLFLLHRFGENVIVIFAVVMNIVLLLNSSFDGIGQSIMPLVSVYRGEGCQKSIVKTMRTANITALIEGVAVSLMLLVFANVLPRAFGITEPELLRQSAFAIRIYCTAAIFFSFIMLYSSYYIYMDKVHLALGITTSYLLVTPVIMGIGFGLLFGINGVWAGMALSSGVTVAIISLYIKKRFPKQTFPLLLDRERLERELSYDVPKTQDGIMSLVHRLESDLEEKGVARIKIMKIMLMIEETQMLALDADEKSRAAIECNILLDDTITVILRDSGKNSDFAGDAPPEEEFLPEMDSISKRIVSMHRDKQYILTGGKNRIIMKF